MASTFSTDLKLELMATGENAGTWGDKTNTNLNLVQQAIAGYQEVSIAGGAQTTALVMSDAALSNARNAVIKFIGTITGNQVVTIPDGIEKTYTLINGTSGTFTVEFKTASGTGFTFATTEKNAVLVFSDGTNVVEITNQLAGLVVGTDVQAFDAGLTDIAGLAVTDGNIIVGNGTNFVAESGATARTSLGLGTASDVQFDSFGVGTAASGTTGEIRATNDVTAFYSSDVALKENIINIPNPLEAIRKLNGVLFDWKKSYIDKRGGEDGYFVRKKDVGVIAQEVEKVLPEAVAQRPDGIKAVKYDRLTCLLIEAVKVLSDKIQKIEEKR
jgi:sarcosine oxidase gamma subunit